MHGPKNVKLITGYSLTLTIHILLCVFVGFLKMLLVTQTIYNRLIWLWRIINWNVAKGSVVERFNELWQCLNTMASRRDGWPRTNVSMLLPEFVPSICPVQVRTLYHLNHGLANFKRIYNQPQNCRHREGETKQFPYWVSTNIWSRRA
jgi:hypothetical protein